MPYLIDGHNLIGQLPDISLEDPNDEAELVLKLIGFAARTRKRCTVIFDSGLPAGPSPMSTGSVKVIFASPRTSADRLILDRIRATPDPGNWTLVSSDRAVLGAARGRGMRAVTSADFARHLAATTTPGDDDAKPDGVRSPDELDAWLRLFGGEES